MVLSRNYRHLSVLLVLFCLTILLLIPTAASAEIKIIQQSLGRDFGIVVGDQIEHSYIISVPAEYTLSVAMLPTKSDINYWLKLISVNYQEVASDKSLKKYKIDVVFQTFYAPLDVRVLSTPAVDVSFHSGDREQQISLPAWGFSMSPLKETASTTSTTGGPSLAFMKPDIPVVAIDTDDLKLQVYLLALAVFIMAFIWLVLTGRVFSFARSPFQLATRQIKKLQARQDENNATHAIYEVHQAFNNVAKQAVFSHQIDEFIVSFPEFGSNKQQITDFYDLSVNILYGDEKAKPDHFKQLLSLCHSLAKAERLVLKK